MQSDARHHAALNVLGIIASQSGELEKACEYFGRAHGLLPSHAEYRSNLVIATGHRAEALSRQGDYASALPLYTWLLTDETDPAMRAGITARIRALTMVAALRDMRDQFDRAGPHAPPSELVSSVYAQIPEATAATTCVFFHIEKFDARLMGQLRGRSGDQIDLRDVLRDSVKAARLTNPTCRVVILTDRHTALPQMDGAQIVRLPLQSDRLIYEKTLAYYALALSARLTGPIVYLDTDICVNRSFSDLDFTPFDIALTYRSDPDLPEMPVNEGVILASSSAAASRFFGLCLGIHDLVCAAAPVRERYAFDIGTWWGPQLSIAAFCDWQVPPKRAEIDDIRGLRCRFLPCEQYNFTPSEMPIRAHLTDKWIVHFKGPRKHWMAHYLAQYQS